MTVTIAVSGPEVGAGAISAGLGQRTEFSSGHGLRAWRKQRCFPGAGIRSYMELAPKVKSKEGATGARF